MAPCLRRVSNLHAEFFGFVDAGEEIVFDGGVFYFAFLLLLANLLQLGALHAAKMIAVTTHARRLDVTHQLLFPLWKGRGGGRGND